MAIPDFQTIMRPLLQLASDGKQHSNREAREILARTFKLNDEEKNALLPSGRQGIFVNRIAWAKAYLQQARLLDTPERGHFTITDRGREALKDAPERITINFLQKFPEFAEFRTPTKKPKGPQTEPSTEEEERTPEETLEAAHLRLRADLAAELLGRVKTSSPRFFEHLVVELLLKMGYGGSREEAGEAVGGAGDEGIDGVISEDRLGLDSIYLQAKRWEGTVGRPEIQKFVGALQGKRARKGVFITTIDGKQLAELMIDFNVGVDPVISYEVKKITLDYFDED